LKASQSKAQEKFKSLKTSYNLTRQKRYQFNLDLNSIRALEIKYKRVVDECNGKIAKLEKIVEDKYNALIDVQHKFDET
jgi:hypothetical protein